MKPQIKEISGEGLQKFWEDFGGEKTFLQSENFGKFREKCGEKIFRFGIFEREKLVGTAVVQKIKTRFKTFCHCPHGPILDEKNVGDWQEFLDFYRAFGAAQKCDFVRISPLLPPEQSSIFAPAGFRSAPVHLVNPEKTWVLDLQKSESEILAEMKKTTRYEVRRAEKSEISVQMGNGEKDLETFWSLHCETARRQKFVPFPKKNTRAQLEVFGKNCQIFSAEIEQRFYSSAIILFDSRAAYYHQAASIYSRLPAAHAVIWSAIREAKYRGCAEFNFWGVVCEHEKSHPWHGLSRFKRGFGGAEKNFVHCHDAPISPKYWLNFGLEKFRKWRRGY